MNPAVLFLIGGAGLAVVLSIVVWLFSRPRTTVEDPNELRRTLRSLRSSSPGSATPLHVCAIRAGRVTFSSASNSGSK